MTAEATVLDYYEALRRGEPLYPYFLESPDTWKAAISTTYDGYDAVAEGLREQSRTTTGWTVESHALQTVERDGWARMTDHVTLAWTTPESANADDSGTGTAGSETTGSGTAGSGTEASGSRHEHETRWSGVLVDRGDEWLFDHLHVSTASEV